MNAKLSIYAPRSGSTKLTAYKLLRELVARAEIARLFPLMMRQRAWNPTHLKIMLVAYFAYYWNERHARN